MTQTRPPGASWSCPVPHDKIPSCMPSNRGIHPSDLRNHIRAAVGDSYIDDRSLDSCFRDLAEARKVSQPMPGLLRRLDKT